MPLELVLRKSRVLAGESVPAEVALRAGAADLEVPADLEVSESLSFALFNTAGEQLAAATARDRIDRIADAVMPPIVGGGGSNSLPPGPVLRLELDLLELFEPPPGDYLVSAAFASEVSARVPLTVEAADAWWADALWDHAFTQLVYTLTRVGEATLFTMHTGTRPENYWRGGTLALPPDARPLVAEVDFATMETFEHDISRWVGWLGDGRLGAARFRMDRQDGEAIELPVDRGLQLVGHPVEHADGTLTLFARRSHEILRLRFDPAARAVTEELFAVIPETLLAIATASSPRGGTFLVAAIGDPPRLRLFTSAERYDIALEHDVRDRAVRVIGLRIDYKTVGQRARAILVATETTEGEQRWLGATEILLAENGAPLGPRRGWRLAADPLLARGETVTAMEIGRDILNAPAIAIATSAGRLLGPQFIDRTTPSLPLHIVESGGKVLVFYASPGRGTRSAILAAPARGL